MWENTVDAYRNTDKKKLIGEGRVDILIYYKVISEFECDGENYIVVKCGNHGVCVMIESDYKCLIKCKNRRNAA